MVALFFASFGLGSCLAVPIVTLDHNSPSGPSGRGMGALVGFVALAVGHPLQGRHGDSNHPKAELEIIGNAADLGSNMVQSSHLSG